LARLSKQCHEKVAAGISVTDLEEQIGELAANLWGLTKEELKGNLRRAWRRWSN